MERDRDQERIQELLAELKESIEQKENGMFYGGHKMFHVEQSPQPEKSTNSKQESGHLEKVKGNVKDQDISDCDWQSPCPICKSCILVGDRYSWTWFIIDHSPLTLKRFTKVHYLCLQRYMLKSKGEVITYGG